MTTIAIALSLAALAGALSGGLIALWVSRRSQRQKPSSPQPAPDPALAANFETAAATWATSQGRPEAAGLVADKLHLIHRIGQKRGWWQ